MKKNNRFLEFLKRWNNDEIDLTMRLEQSRPNEKEHRFPTDSPKKDDASAEKDIERRAKRYVNIGYNIICVFACIVITAFLICTAASLPDFGSADTPDNNEVVEKYVEDGMKDTGAVNVVAGIILDYRAFDTLGESFVLFTATCAVIILMRSSHTKESVLKRTQEDKLVDLGSDSILSMIGKMMIPFIFLLGFYIIANGHLSPGGGFSGGAVIGSGFILYASIFGFEKADRFLSSKVIKTVTCCALSFYAVSKVYSFFTGANHLPSFISAGTPGNIFSAGLILPLNLSVGCVVACTMYSFYSLFKRGTI